MTDGFVLDCSVTMTWCFSDEATSYGDWVLRSLETTRALVPRLWHLEVANVLLIAEKKKRIRESEVVQFVHLLEELPIDIDEMASSMMDLIALGRGHTLTAYDSCYLQLALIHGLPLATLDNQLKKEAARAGVAIYSQSLQES